MALEVHKPSQGVYARGITGVGGGLLAAFGGYWFHGALIDLPPVTQGAQLLGIQLTWGLIAAVVVFGILAGSAAMLTTGAPIGVKKLDRLTKASTDFLIETETELRKVSWPSREELTGSTFVVIFVTVVLGVYIVIIDKVVSAIMTRMHIL